MRPYIAIAIAFAAALALVGCKSTPEQTAATTGTGTQATGTAPAGTGAETAAVTPGTKQDFTVNVGDTVYFGFDRYDLTPEAQAQLQKQAAWLKTYPNVSVIIEGHCDERGTREYNLALGERRANAVRDYLIALGIAPNRLQTISYGKERPAVIAFDEAGYALNRRAVTVVQ
ncbi:MAG: peptidoglycan-associated lipoprotein Pal [Rhodospirillaceae bacterium]|nr:peptidoglycan-associated lipoprotein Pal [Rhodospirillaceae bacterium]